MQKEYLMPGADGRPGYPEGAASAITLRSSLQYMRMDEAQMRAIERRLMAIDNAQEGRA